MSAGPLPTLLRLGPATNDRQIGLQLALLRGTILLVGNFYLWSLCKFPGFRLEGRRPDPRSRQSAYSARVLRSGDCLDRVDRLLPSILPSTSPECPSLKKDEPCCQLMFAMSAFQTNAKKLIAKLRASVKG